MVRAEDFGKARSIGKSVRELMKYFVVEKIQEEEKEVQLSFDVPKLDYRKYISIILLVMIWRMKMKFMISQFSKWN